MIQVYVGGVIYFGLNCALAYISAFLPTIIQTFGFSASLPLPVIKWTPNVSADGDIATAITQLLTVPPYAVAAVVITITSYASDRMQNRGLFMIGANMVGGFGYL